MSGSGDPRSQQDHEHLFLVILSAAKDRTARAAWLA